MEIPKLNPYYDKESRLNVKFTTPVPLLGNLKWDINAQINII